MSQELLPKAELMASDSGSYFVSERTLVEMSSTQVLWVEAQFKALIEENPEYEFYVEHLGGARWGLLIQWRKIRERGADEGDPR